MRASKIVAILSILFVIGGSLGALVTGTEPFPFSDYPMYSRSFNPVRYNYLELVGIKEDNTEWKIPVIRVYRPLTEAAFVEAIRVHHRYRTNKNPQILADLFAQYEKRRARLLPKGPQLKGLRLYKTEFDWHEFRQEKFNNPLGTPFNPPPQSRELLHEVLQ